MSYEAGKKIHAYDQYIDKQKCLALLSWYAFTVCDTVSGFWIVREAFSEITDVFARPS